MRKFYEVMPNSELQEYMYIANYELNGFNYLSLIEAKPSDQNLLNRVKVYIHDKNAKPIDFMSGPLSWPIISGKFLELISDDIRGDVQLLTPPLYSLSSGKKMTDYHLINILKQFECVDTERSVIGPGPTGEDFVYELYIRADVVPDDVNIFRVSKSFGAFIVSEEFLAKIRGKGLTGLVMSEV